MNNEKVKEKVKAISSQFESFSFKHSILSSFLQVQEDGQQMIGHIITNPQIIHHDPFTMINKMRCELYLITQIHVQSAVIYPASIQFTPDVPILGRDVNVNQNQSGISIVGIPCLHWFSHDNIVAEVQSHNVYNSNNIINNKLDHYNFTMNRKAKIG